MIFTDSLAAINLAINNKIEMQMKNYQSKGKDVKHMGLIKRIHDMLEKHDNIEIKHVFIFCSPHNEIISSYKNTTI